VPERVATTDPEGVDYGWVMQTTFVLTIVAGAPLVVVASIGVDLPTWTSRALFAVRVGAAVWFLTAVVTYLYARSRVDDERESAIGRTDTPASDAEREPSGDAGGDGR
jgi:hypothetical protein